jgi:hypothetical protein
MQLCNYLVKWIEADCFALIDPSKIQIRSENPINFEIWNQGIRKRQAHPFVPYDGYLFVILLGIRWEQFHDKVSTRNCTVNLRNTRNSHHWNGVWLSFCIRSDRPDVQDAELCAAFLQIDRISANLSKRASYSEVNHKLIQIGDSSLRDSSCFGSIEFQDRAVKFNLLSIPAAVISCDTFQNCERLCLSSLSVERPLL